MTQTADTVPLDKQSYTFVFAQARACLRRAGALIEELERRAIHDSHNLARGWLEEAGDAVLIRALARVEEAERVIADRRCAEQERQAARARSAAADTREAMAGDMDGWA